LSRSNGCDMHHQQGSGYWRINLYRLSSNRRHVYYRTVLPALETIRLSARGSSSVHRINCCSGNRSMDRMDNGFNSTLKTDRRYAVTRHRRTDREEKQGGSDFLREPSPVSSLFLPLISKLRLVIPSMVGENRQRVLLGNLAYMHALSRRCYCDVKAEVGYSFYTG